jgi:type III pantothenate kinase
MNYTFVDIGNTNTKIYKGGFTSIYKNTELEKVVSKNNFENVVVSSVVGNLTKLFKKAFILSSKSPFSFNFNIEGIGVDRLLVVEGAKSLTNKDFVVVDFGTAITIDFFNFKENRLLGGLILPGFNLSFNSLHKHTSKLPNISLGDNFDNINCDIKVIGENTKEAILYGVINVISRGIEAIIKEKGIYNIFITGGNASLFQKTTKLKVSYEKDLIFKGMDKVRRSL